MSLFLKMETFVYKNFIVPLQGKHTFDFVSEHYQKGDRVLDFGCGIGSNSKLFNPEDYIGVEVDESRVGSARLKYPESQFKQIPFISSEDDKIPFEDNSFDIVFISLCLHHIDSSTCKLLFTKSNENILPFFFLNPTNCLEFFSLIFSSPFLLVSNFISRLFSINSNTSFNYFIYSFISTFYLCLSLDEERDPNQ